MDEWLHYNMNIFYLGKDFYFLWTISYVIYSLARYRKLSRTFIIRVTASSLFSLGFQGIKYVAMHPVKTTTKELRNIPAGFQNTFVDHATTYNGKLPNIGYNIGVLLTLPIFLLIHPLETSIDLLAGMMHRLNLHILLNLLNKSK